MDSPNNDKNSALNKKIKEKEKEMGKKPQPMAPMMSMPGMPMGMPGMQGMMQMGQQGAMPFQMISGAPQGASSGFFPLMQNQKELSSQIKKDGNNSGQKQGAPQIIPFGMQGMPMMGGGIPGGMNMGGLGSGGMASWSKHRYAAADK